MTCTTSNNDYSRASYLAISEGEGLAGKVVNVTNFGFPNPRCPPNTGANVTVGQSGIFFINVARAGPRGSSPHQATFGVTDICSGGKNITENGIVAEVLADGLPENTIPLANRGTEPFCTLPTVKRVVETPKTDAPPTNNDVHKRSVGVLVLFLLSAFALSL